jgi:putative transcriptional regulator
MKRPEYRSAVAAAVHEGVRGMHRLALVNKKTMREFDVRCLTAVEELSAADIRGLRETRGREPSDPRPVLDSPRRSEKPR